MEVNFWAHFKQFLLFQIPFLLIWVVGIILSIRFRKRNLQKFRFVFIAFTIFLIGSTGDVFTSSLSYVPFSNSNQYIPGMLYWISLLINVIAWAVLLNAIFNQRLNSVNEKIQLLGIKKNDNRA